jgi:mannan endo-1,4-beta-mannosidase
MPRTAARALAGLTVAALLGGCGLSAPMSAGSGTPAGQRATGQPPAPAHAHYSMHALTDPPAGKFLGVEADGEPASLTPLISLAASIGRKPNLAGQYVAWGAPFDGQGALNAWNYGALYYMAWEPFTTSVQAIADGASNAYVTKFAKAVRALGLPVAISFGHEMNGDWYPWGSSQTPASVFVAAWRHIHDLFAKAGARNVIWVWNPNVINPVPAIKLRPYWPGRAYVSWIGLTGYFALTGPHTFARVFEPTMREIRRFTGKPFIIAETSVESGPAEAACVRSLVAGVAQHSDVLGFIWFDYDKLGIDWRIESRPQVRAAIASAVAGLPLVSVG